MKKDLVTIVWGDSIVYGWHDVELGGWVNRLKINLSKKSKSNFVFNLGIPGQNSNDIVNRFEKELIDRFNSEDNFKLIFSFGIKDALLINKNKNHLDKFENNIIQIIKKAKEFTNDICFIGLIKPNFNIREEYKADAVTMIDDTIKKQCELNDLKYIEMKHIITEKDLADGLHPNPIGYDKITNEVLKEF